MEYDKIIEQLTKVLSPKRLQHSIGVSQTAKELAEVYGVDPQTALIAGTLHDCARELPEKQLLSLAKSFGIVIDIVDSCEPVLLHAPIAAQIVQKEYGIADKQIHRAIALHTTGGSDMNALDKIIYLADVIEPNRDFNGVDTLRKMAKIDLDKALLLAFDQSIKYIISNGGLIHPATIVARNQIVMANRQ